MRSKKKSTKRKVSKRKPKSKVKKKKASPKRVKKKPAKAKRKKKVKVAPLTVDDMFEKETFEDFEISSGQDEFGVEHM